MKLGAERAKLVQLMQKLVPQRRVGVFRNERTRSTPLEPKLMFWCISYHLGPPGFLTKLGAKHSELVQKFVPRSHVGVFRDEHTRSTPLEHKHSFCCISYHLGPFGTVSLPYETRCNVELVQKFVSRSCIGIFRNKHTRSTPLDPKLMFW